MAEETFLTDLLNQINNYLGQDNAKYQTRWYKTNTKSNHQKIYLNSDDVRELLLFKLKGKISNNLSLHLADEGYYLPPLEDVEEIVKNSELDMKKWVEERFDCDDFAICLKARFAEAAYKDGKRRMAHCMGVIWGYFDGEPHAMNWVITEDKVFRLIEPQTSEIMAPTNKDKDIWFILA